MMLTITSRDPKIDNPRKKLTLSGVRLLDDSFDHRIRFRRPDLDDDHGHVVVTLGVFHEPMHIVTQILKNPSG